MTKIQRPCATTLIAIMTPLVTLFCFALDLYVPLIPTIKIFFQASHTQMQATNSYFMLTTGLGQLIFGPISDTLGRTKVLIISLLLFILGNLCCWSAQCFELFMAGRILQALGSCGCYLTCFASIKDLYTCNNLSTTMFGYLNMVGSVPAIIAPSIGTQLAYQYGWPSIFVLMGTAALITLGYCYFLYPDTVHNNQNRYKGLETTFKNYQEILANKYIQAFTLPACLGVSSYFSLYSVSPYIYMENFGFSKAGFSLCYGTFGLSFLLGNTICSIIVKHYGILRTLSLGLGLHLLCNFVLLTTIHFESFYVIHPCLMLLIFSAALMVTAGIGGSMVPFKHMPGTAFAVISASKFTVCFILSELVVFFFDRSLASYAITFLFFDIISAILIMILAHQINTQTQNDTIRQEVSTA